MPMPCANVMATNMLLHSAASMGALGGCGRNTNRLFGKHRQTNFDRCEAVFSEL